MNRKTFKLILLAFVLLGFMVFFREKNPSNQIFKIGVAVPLTGNNGFAGESVRNAISLAKSKLGKTKYEYEIIFEDTQVDPKSAATTAQKLISVDRVDAIISAYAPIGVVISPLAEEAKVVHVGIAFDVKVAEGEYNFINFNTPDTSVKKFLEEMKKRNLKTLGIIHLNNPGIFSVYEPLKNMSREYGIEIVADQEIQPGERDFRSTILKSKPANPDIYAILSITPEIEILAKQMKELGLANLTSIIYFEVSPNKSLYEGLWSVGFGKASGELEEEYLRNYGAELSWAAPYAYDSFNMIVKSVELHEGAQKPTTNFVANKMRGIKNYAGVVGDLSADEKGIFDSPVTIKVVKDGKLILAE